MSDTDNIDNQSNISGLDGAYSTSGTREPDVTGATIDNLEPILDYAFSEAGGPSYTSPLVNIMRGIKILGQGPQMAPIADDTIGLSFITRPLLNLSDDNCSKHMRLATLFKPASGSAQEYVKGLLDRTSGNNITSQAFDNKSAWMPILINLTKSSDGFPDIDLDMGTTGGGFRGEVHQYVDGVLDENGKYTLTQTYYNAKGGIVPFIFEIWLQYIYEVTTGDNNVEPYPEAVYQNYIDYDCRIYHLIMEKDNKSISHIFMSIQSIPVTFPAGAFAAIDNDSNNRRGQGQEEISIQYSSIGFRYDTWEVCDGFNGSTIYFNPDMANNVRATKNVLLRPSEWTTFQYASYPWININAMIMEWWCPVEIYNKSQDAFVIPKANIPTAGAGTPTTDSAFVPDALKAPQRNTVIAGSSNGVKRL